MKPLVIGISGASGAVYGQRLLSILVEKQIKTHLFITKPALKVIKEELNIDLGDEPILSRRNMIRFLGSKSPDFIMPEGLEDWDSPLASGSYRTKALVVIPCSMATLSAIAVGNSRTLLERRADIMLKENERLILVPRETPLNRIHLRHMLAMSEMGADIVPAMPAFYHNPQKIGDLVDFIVGKILDLLEIPHNLFRRWQS